LNILNDLDAVTFEDAWKNKKVITMFDVPVNFIGLDELLKIKAKAGREQDIADIKILQRRNKKNK
jgi:predicted nucleotidyltransferase